MNDLFFKYIKERENTDHIKNNKGFITYRMEGELLNVFDLYILPEYRRENIATKLCDELVALAKECGCKKARAGVCLKSNGSTEALKFHLSQGMKLESCIQNYIFLSKEL